MGVACMSVHYILAWCPPRCRSLGFGLETEIGFHVGAGNQTEFAGRTVSVLNLSHLSSPFYILKCHTSSFRHLMVRCDQLYCVCVFKFMS